MNSAIASFFVSVSVELVIIGFREFISEFGEATLRKG